MSSSSVLLERNPVPPLPQGFNPKQIDPALLTFDEYYRIANETGKFHPDSAYNHGLDHFKNASYLNRSLFPRLIKRVKLNGLMFEFRLRMEKLGYSKRDTNGDYVRDASNNTVAMTDAEIAAAGVQTHGFMIGIYDEDGQCCGSAQDEWGCVLVNIAREYRGFGLGPLLTQMARTFEPGKTSGGFTSSGLRSFTKFYRESVRRALTTGRYTELVKQGQITPARVKAIIASAKLQQRPAKQNRDLSSTDPADWLLYAEDGCFVLYDRKLREVVGPEHGGDDDVWMWGERMIKGYLLVRIPNETGLCVRFGGDSDVIKKFLLTLGAEFCAGEGTRFAVDEEDLPFVDRRHLSVGPVNKATGISGAIVTPTGDLTDPRGMARAEAAFRRSFDRYGEFHSWLLDLADRKFRPEDKR